MTRYELNIPEDTIALAKKHGFDPSASISPSAMGAPIPSGLSPEDADSALDSMLSASRNWLLEARQAGTAV